MTNKEKLTERIIFRCSKKTSGWYKNFALMTNITVSELFRRLPIMYDTLDQEVDKLITKLNELKFPNNDNDNTIH